MITGQRVVYTIPARSIYKPGHGQDLVHHGIVVGYTADPNRAGSYGLGGLVVIQTDSGRILFAAPEHVIVADQEAA